MAATILNISEIVSDPKIRSGRPVIAGTGLCVSDIVINHFYNNETPEDIAVGFRLSLGQVYAALAYYHLHKDEIDEEIRRGDEEAKQLIAELEKQGKLKRIEQNMLAK
jgi:uncharacterized protein (DUF433 family)